MNGITELDPVPDDPRQMGVPHSSWQPAQRDIVGKMLTSDKKVVIAEAPTGTGKSAVSAALGSNNNNVTVLVNNIALGEQLVNQYGFKGVWGRDKYLCVKADKQEKWKRIGRIPTAADCHYTKMTDCPVASSCPYIVAKMAARRAPRCVVTRAYGALSLSIKQREGFLVLDEAHSLASDLLEFGQLSITLGHLKSCGLPMPPSYDDGYGEPDRHTGIGRGAVIDPDMCFAVREWLYTCIESLCKQSGVKSEAKPSFNDFGEGWGKGEAWGNDEESAKRKRMVDRLRLTLEDITPYRYFLRVGPHAIQERGVSPGIFLRSLDAKIVANSLWSAKSKVLLMSGTIGDPGIISKWLGINDDDYEYCTYPHPTPLDKRPIYDLEVDRMTMENLRQYPGLYKAQASRIESFLSDYPKDWRGIILTSSGERVRILRAELARRMPDRVLLPKQERLMDRVREFTASNVPGVLAVETIQGMGTGIDLHGDLGRISIVAGIDYWNPSDALTNALRQIEGGQAYLDAIAFWGAMQAPGRVSRGERDASGEYIENVSALADGRATSPKAMRFYAKSPWFYDAIRKR